MKITVLGSGHIGGTLAKQWIKAGHQVRFGARDPHKAEVQNLVGSLGTNASVSEMADAIAFGEVILFAIPGTVMDATIAAHAAALDGKIIIDAANKIGAPVTHSMPIFAAQTPKAMVYRAFNTYGWENFEEPQFNGVPADMFYCGPDGEPRAVVEKLISDVGLNPLYVGGPDQVDLVESILRLWFTLSMGQKKGRHLAFKVLTR